LVTLGVSVPHKTGIIGLGSDNRALDAFGDVYVHERTDGDLAIRGFKDAKEIARIKLPTGQLGYLRAANVSPDLRWLAISEQSRGGLWDLAKGERVFYTRGFTGATVSPQGVVQADFRKISRHEKANSPDGSICPPNRSGQRDR
jgi:hypothetical protein